MLKESYMILYGVGDTLGKMFQDSSFYAPIHPTVEEQVALARKISDSLSDISNQQSKGQTMYVKRKKKSVKWIHEGKIQQFQLHTKNMNQTNHDVKPSICVNIVWIICLVV